jgi:hypothetical protein
LDRTYFSSFAKRIGFLGLVLLPHFFLFKRDLGILQGRWREMKGREGVLKGENAGAGGFEIIWI